MSIELKPCPFCGGSDFEIVENGRIWSGMKYSEPVSVSVRHWCPAAPGQPSRMIERVGRDEASAVTAWNTRHTLSQQPATPKPVGFTYQAEIEYADSTGGNGAFWRVPPDLDDEAVPLYDRPAPSVPGDVVRDAERYRWLREHGIMGFTGAPGWLVTVAFAAMDAHAQTLDSNIDAAMLAAKDASA